MNDNILVYKEIAEGIFNFLDAVSKTHKCDEKFQTHSWHIWVTLYGNFIDQSENAAKYIQTKLEDLLLKRLKDNLKSGSYPPIMRPLLTIFGLKAKSDLQDKVFRKKFFDYVKDNFKGSVKKFGDAALKNLPQRIKYDADRGILTDTKTSDTLTLK